ncbi:MAG TPA: hypothetical protein VFF52_16125 [Isosphaeraceae bacterium]|nr:hypothetical protein [Isosphaeraceae bacterium]
MFRGRDIKKRIRRKLELGVEALDDRVVLSAAAPHAAAVTVAAHHPSVTARFEAAVDRLSSQFQRQLAHFNGLVNTQINRENAVYQGMLSQSVARINDGEALNGPRDEASLSQASTAVAKNLNQSLTRVDLKFNRFAQSFDNRLYRLGQQDVKAAPALEAAVIATRGNFQSAEASFISRVNDEFQEESNALQTAIGSVEKAVAASPAARVAARSTSLGAPTRSATATGSGAITSIGTTTGIGIGTGMTSGAGPTTGVVGTTATAGVAGSTGNGAFGVGSFGGTGNLVGGTPPSPVTGTTGAGVDTGLDDFGIGSGIGTGTGIDLTPNGTGLLF